MATDYNETIRQMGEQQRVTVKETTESHERSLVAFGEKIEACEERRDAQTDRICTSIEKGNDRFINAISGLGQNK